MIALRKDFDQRFSQDIHDMFGEGGALSSAKSFEYRPEQQQMGAASDPERRLMGLEIGKRISSALTRLTPRERMVFEMKHYQGLKLRAIGEALGTSEETVKNSLFRATRKLRTELEGLL